MTLVKIKLDVKDAAYISANPTKVLALNEPIYRNDGLVAYGDGVTPLSGLTFLPLFSVGGGQPALYKDAGLFTHTGVTSEEKIYSHLITAGTILASDLITVIIRAFPNGGGGSKTIRIKANTIDSLVGATTLVTYTFTISALTLRRHMFMQNSLTSELIMLPTTSDADDGDTAYNAASAASSLLSVNLGINQYIMVSAQLASASDQILFYHSIATVDR